MSFSTFLLPVGMFAVLAVSLIVGMFIGSAMNFRRFGSSGLALIGTGVSFALCVTVALSTGGDAISWVFAALAAAIFGTMMRGAAFN